MKGTWGFGSKWERHSGRRGLRVPGRGGESLVMNGDWFLGGASRGGEIAGGSRWVWTSVNPSFYSDILTANYIISLNSFHKCLYMRSGVQTLRDTDINS